MSRASADRILLLFTLAALGCGDGEAPVEVRRGTAVDHGQALFTDRKVSSSPDNFYSCSTCHAALSSDLQQSKPGAVLAGAVARPSYWGGTELDLLAAINHCLFFFMQHNEVWTAEDESAKGLFAWLESLPASDAERQAVPFTVVTDIADLPGGDAGRGADVYARSCQLCHASAHSAQGRTLGAAPRLPGDFLTEHPLSEYTPAQRRLTLIEKVRHGGFLGYGGEMPPLSLEKLSDAELADLIDYLGPYDL
jgi:thiosulfate dehydrogenase